MPPFLSQPPALRTIHSLLRANFTTCRPTYRALPPNTRGSVRRPLPRPVPISRRSQKGRPSSPRNPANSPPPGRHEPQQSSAGALSLALQNEDNKLQAPVHIPEDQDGIITPEHPATSILSNSSLVVTRQLELMNVMMGFEQANKYTIMDPQGNHIGYMAERDLGMGNMMKRQFFSTHRSFTTHVFDRSGKEVLRV